MINMKTIIKARRLHHQGLSVRQIAKAVDCGIATVYLNRPGFLGDLTF